jgi:CRISPR/Cas system CSM-associated protein Csm3 (group 7 of RAMP superfamily)
MKVKERYTYDDHGYSISSSYRLFFTPCDCGCKKDYKYLSMWKLEVCAVYNNAYSTNYKYTVKYFTKDKFPTRESLIEWLEENHYQNMKYDRSR